VHIFAWKLIQDGLATKHNKKKRTIIKEAVCDLCGKDVETEHHAASLREIWDLPAESTLAFNGPEWLIMLIDREDAEVAAQLVLVLWRSWFVRNELTHNGRWMTTRTL